MRLLNNFRRDEDLRDFPLFSETTRPELARIRRLLMQLTVPAGKVLIREGARGDEFMIIADGVAEVTQGGRHVATIGRGDLVGEMALLQESGRGRRNATVTATTDLTVYVGTPAEFRQILDVAPSVAEKVRETAASRALQAA
jgi:CRP/FNR family transcriptional regulator, cyclic AMP receptor protein